MLPPTGISNVLLGIANGGIGLYGVQWEHTPPGTQYVSVKYQGEFDVEPIDVVGSLPVSASGIPVDGTPFMVVENAVPGVYYDVIVQNNSEDTSKTVRVTMPQLLMGNNYLVDDFMYLICSNDPKFLYSKAVFAPGVTLYNDILLTDPIDETLATQVSLGYIHPVTAGVVGASTGYGCYFWSAGFYILSNSILCSGTVVELYTNGSTGATLTGDRLFTDKELITPQTGYSYVLDVSSGIRYVLNPVDGFVGAEAGECTDFYNVDILNNNSRRVINGIFGIEGFQLQAVVGTGDEETGAHIAFTGSISLSIQNGGTCDGCGVDEAELLVNGVSTETIDVQEGVYFFTSRAYTGSEIIKIVLKENLVAPAP